LTKKQENNSKGPDLQALLNIFDFPEEFDIQLQRGITVKPSARNK
jgi:hypothetical protein